MDNKTNFLKKLITSIYDIKVFSKYAKEGIVRAVVYVMLLTLILAATRGIFMKYEFGNSESNSIAFLIEANFVRSIADLLINCLIVTAVAFIFAIFMKMIVKYLALYSLTLYAATLPLIIQTILEIINPDINFDAVFIAGTLTYVMLILKYIKDEIISNFNTKKSA